MSGADSQSGPRAAAVPSGFPGHPTVVIAGAPKCGTSALFDYLADHPQICPASVKETYYLIDPGYPLFRAESNLAQQGAEGYAAFFRHCAGAPETRAWLEATPDYLYQETALAHLSGLRPQPRIVFVLRRPADRIYSLYRFAQQNMAVLPPDLSFPAFLERVEEDHPSLAGRDILRHAFDHSRYSTYLRRWLEAFESDRVKVLIFEEMIREPREALTQLSGWLGIGADFYEAYAFTKKNESVAVRHHGLHAMRRRLARALPGFLKPRVLRRTYDRLNVTRPPRGRSPEDQAALDALEPRFASEVEALAALTGLDFSRWQHPDKQAIGAASPLAAAGSS